MDRGGLYFAAVSCCLGISSLLVSCTYLQHAAKQSEYSRIQAQNPSQQNLKHMIDRQTFLVYGRILGASDTYSDLSFGVAAFSDRYKENELVDSTPIHRVNTHYGLNLPAGDYELLVLADLDRNGTLDQTEVVGRRLINLSDETFPQRVAGNVDMPLSQFDAADWAINIPIPPIVPSQESLFYPKGTLRHLSDPLFDADFAALGMYEPAAFLEVAPTMFYALEEDSFKVPIIFVHGIGGSAREFATIVSRLDRQLYTPWFFYYPSGSDLDQMAEIFYNIFLSGNAVPWSPKPMIIVAHSMGGLVVREAMNKYQGTENENRVDLLVTIATPFGGHPAAAMGEKRSPLVLPSWRDLNPEGAFISRLYRKPLPAHLSHQLLYSYGNPGTLKLGENSDGVVPLSSQLYAKAQLQAAGQFGFNTSHTGVLKDEDAIQRIVESIGQVRSDEYPQSHIDALIAGGFDVDLDASYSDTEKHFIRTMGNYMALLANGTLDPLGDPILEHFVLAVQGEAKAKTDPETAWLKFIQDYPYYVD
jgi:pimeloyl-ACP methyl ester carboxylesterase